MILSRRRALDRMKDQGVVSNHKVLYNEISAAYRMEIKTTNMTFQLVPLDDHRPYLAEKAIQTWKYHFVGVISGTKSGFLRLPLVPINTARG